VHSVRIQLAVRCILFFVAILVPYGHASPACHGLCSYAFVILTMPFHRFHAAECGAAGCSLYIDAAVSGIPVLLNEIPRGNKSPTPGLA